MTNELTIVTTTTALTDVTQELIDEWQLYTKAEGASDNTLTAYRIGGRGVGAVAPGGAD